MQKTGIIRFIAANILYLLLFALLSSCTILPRSGPTKADVYKSSRGQIPIIAITVPLAHLVNPHPSYPWILQHHLGSHNYETLGVGDKINIHIWENASEGLYTGNTKGAADLGISVVSGTGKIDVPYLGKVQAAGKTTDELQRQLVLLLKNKTINPQVLISKTEGLSKHISIQGIVPKPGTFEIMSGKHDLISLLAEAGGSTLAPELTNVMLERKGQKFQTTLVDLFQTPHKNINLLPGDNIIITELSDTFTVLGATKLQKLIKFPKKNLSLIEAIALAEGMNDELARPSNVFLLRYENNNLLNKLMAYPDTTHLLPGASPVIYELNMKKMQAVFAAQSFQIKNQDLIITTDAPYTNVRKIFSNLGSAVNIGQGFG